MRSARIPTASCPRACTREERTPLAESPARRVPSRRVPTRRAPRTHALLEMHSRAFASLSEHAECLCGAHSYKSTLQKSLPVCVQLGHDLGPPNKALPLEVTSFALSRRPWRRGRSIDRRRRSGAEGSAGVTKSKARVRLLSCPQQASRSHHQRSHSVRFHASSLITSECQLPLQGGQHPSHVSHPFPKSACRQPWSERCNRCASIGPPRCSDAAGRAV